MKTKLFLMGLFVVIVGFSACKDESSPKSTECDITLFTVGTIKYDINGLNITYIYPKTGADQWSSAPAGKVAPAIVYSSKATIDPPVSEPQDFLQTGGVRYTVTAQDGKTQKIYTVKATKVATIAY